MIIQEKSQIIRQTNIRAEAKRLLKALIFPIFKIPELIVTTLLPIEMHHWFNMAECLTTDMVHLGLGFLKTYSAVQKGLIFILYYFYIVHWNIESERTHSVWAGVEFVDFFNVLYL